MERQEIIELMNQYQLDEATERLQTTNYLQTFDGKLLKLLIVNLKMQWIEMYRALEKIEIDKNDPMKLVNTLKLSIINYFMGLESYETCKQYFDSMSDNDKKELLEYEGWYYIARGQYLRDSKRDLEGAQPQFAHGLEIGQKCNDETVVMYAKLKLAQHYAYTFESEKLIYEMKNLLNYAEEVDNKYFILHFLMNICINSLNIGDIITAHEAAIAAIKICDEEGFTFRKINFLSYLSDVYKANRQLDKALKVANRAIELIKMLVDQDELNLDALPNYPFVYGLIEFAYYIRGSVYFERGEFELAIHDYEQSIKIIKNIKATREEPLWVNPKLSIRLFFIIFAYVRLENIEEAKKVLSELEDLDQEDNSLTIDVRLGLARGVILTKSNRMRDRVSAIDTFKEIIVNNKTFFSEANLALYFLCDLLLEEVRMYNSAEAFEEVSGLIERFSKIVASHVNPKYQVELLLLQAKIAMINEEFNKIEGLLNKAIELIENRGYDYLETRIAKERANFNLEFMKWKKLSDQSTTIRERISKSEIQNYIKLAIEYKDEVELPNESRRS